MNFPMNILLLFMLSPIILLTLSPNLCAKVKAEFNGSFIQGGLVIGKTKPSHKVTINDNLLRISKKGAFLIGFGRDAPLDQKVKITSPSGDSKIYNLKIKKRSYKVSRISGLPQSKVAPNLRELAQIKRDNKKIADVRLLDSPLDGFMSKFIWPVKGRISGVFGSMRILNNMPKSPHNGVDIAAPKGTPIVAPADGIIRLTDNDMFLAGKTIIIDHGHGLSSIYIHLEKIIVSLNQNIEKGEIIGHLGMTGRATGPHLHWGLTLFEKHLAPKLVVAE